MDQTTLLNEAMAAIRLGDLSKGKQLLTRVLNRHPQNETALLWMTQVVTDDQRRIDYLNRVLEVNPAHQKAQKGREVIERRVWAKMSSKDLLQEANNRSKGGNQAGAERVLQYMLEQIPNNHQFWLWAALNTDDLHIKREYLRRVIKINPNNETAQKGLRRLEMAMWQDMKEDKFFEVIRKTLREGDRDTASRAMQWKLEREPDNAEAWMLLYDVSTDDEAKIEYLDRIAEINPKFHRLDKEIRIMNMRNPRNQLHEVQTGRDLQLTPVEKTPVDLGQALNSLGNGLMALGCLILGLLCLFMLLASILAPG